MMMEIEVEIEIEDKGIIDENFEYLIVYIFDCTFFIFSRILPTRLEK